MPSQAEEAGRMLESFFLFFYLPALPITLLYSQGRDDSLNSLTLLILFLTAH